MEGVGSRLGRASSRYGPTTVFNGPVRKWKKKWVQVSSSSSSSTLTSYQNPNSQSQGSRLLLCRWTPISSAADTNSTAPEEPPKRKFRYTPIAVLEERKKAVAKKTDEEAKMSETDQSMNRPTTKSNETQRPNCNEVVKEETKDANMNTLDLGYGFKGKMDSVGQSSEGQLKSKTGGAFWSVS